MQGRRLKKRLGSALSWATANKKGKAHTGEQLTSWKAEQQQFQPANFGSMLHTDHFSETELFVAGKFQQLVTQICPALWTATGHWSSSNKLTFKTLCQVIHGLLFKEYGSLLKNQAIIAVEENSTLLCHDNKIFSASLSSNYPHLGGVEVGCNNARPIWRLLKKTWNHKEEADRQHWEIKLHPRMSTWKFQTQKFFVQPKRTQLVCIMHWNLKPFLTEIFACKVIKIVCRKITTHWFNWHHLIPVRLHIHKRLEMTETHRHRRFSQTGKL